MLLLLVPDHGSFLREELAAERAGEAQAGEFLWMQIL